MEPCFRTIFTLFSKKRTNGLAIMEIIHPTTKGMKKTINFGKTKQRHTMVNNATSRFTNIFKYFVDCFILLLLWFEFPHFMIYSAKGSKTFWHYHIGY